MGIGVVALLAWVAATGRAPALLRLDAGAWGWALLTGVLLSAYVATWFGALAHAPAVDVTAVLVAGALVTAFLDSAVQGTPLRPELTGLLLIAAGVALVCVAAARVRRRAPVALEPVP
jgi:drug/metabolite transporter (DMT)-like permease